MAAQTDLEPNSAHPLSELASIFRLHIIGVAVVACLVFGWLLHGDWQFGIAAIGGIDWMLINLLNRITDLQEDLTNNIRGTERVARHRRLFIIGWLLLFLGSFSVSIVIWPELTWLRAIVQVIGLGYSVAIVPTPSGLKRFKDLYFFKNFMSATLFVLTCFIYGFATHDWTIGAGATWWTAGTLIAFFVLYELTYEIIYDLRDLPGDTEAGVPTYPVVHGETRARQIVDGLLLASFAVLLTGLALGTVGVREGLMLAAPVVQFVVYRPRYRRGLTSRDCIAITHLGTGLLLLYVLGNQIWMTLGMPANIWIGS